MTLDKYFINKETEQTVMDVCRNTSTKFDKIIKDETYCTYPESCLYKGDKIIDNTGYPRCTMVDKRAPVTNTPTSTRYMTKNRGW